MESRIIIVDDDHNSFSEQLRTKIALDADKISDQDTVVDLVKRFYFQYRVVSSYQHFSHCRD